MTGYIESILIVIITSRANVRPIIPSAIIKVTFAVPY